MFLSCSRDNIKTETTNEILKTQIIDNCITKSSIHSDYLSFYYINNYNRINPNKQELENKLFQKKSFFDLKIHDRQAGRNPLPRRQLTTATVARTRQRAVTTM